MKMTNNTILVSEGGSGIGREVARRFSALGNTVIVAGRCRAALEETIAGRDQMYAAMLETENLEAIEAFAEQVIAAHPQLNILVANAALQYREDLTRRRDLRQSEKMIAANLLAPMRLINVLVDHLSAQPNAAILNLSTRMGFVSGSSMATYAATDAAMRSYARSLRMQLKGKVQVLDWHHLPGGENASPAGRLVRGICRWMGARTR